VKTFDLIVIGGGPAGYNSAEYAAHRGQSVLLIEKKNLGGTCLNAGCIPTKTFLYASKIYHYANGSGKPYGVEAGEAVLDHAAVVEKKDEVVKTLVQGVAGGLRREKVQVVTGTAKVAKKDGTIIVSTEKESFAAKNLIVATGSAPAVPPIEGVKEELAKGTLVTSDEILDMKEVPGRLVIVGGGVIGFEMAAYFQEAGAKVTVVEMLDKVLGPNDREVSVLLQKEMEKKGVTFHLSSSVTKIADGIVTFTKDGKTETVEYDKVLMCVGRRPNSNVEGLAELGVQMERGAVVTDDCMRTNVPNVYAIGDVNGKVMLAHVGYREGEVAVNNVLGKKDAMSYDAICGVVYTNPEAAFVGMSEEQAKAAGIAYTVKKVSINFSGRHVVENGMSDGICKLIIDTKKGIIIGAALMSSYASEYIYSLALMIQNKIPVESIQKTVFPHPTVCEIIREALFS
jgi:dihydrolipoamide dehydrogenase